MMVMVIHNDDNSDGEAIMAHGDGDVVMTAMMVMVMVLVMVMMMVLVLVLCTTLCSLW